MGSKQIYWLSTTLYTFITSRHDSHDSSERVAMPILHQHYLQVILWTRWYIQAIIIDLTSKSASLLLQISWFEHREPTSTTTHWHQEDISSCSIYKANTLLHKTLLLTDWITKSQLYFCIPQVLLQRRKYLQQLNNFSNTNIDSNSQRIPKFIN